MLLIGAIVIAIGLLWLELPAPAVVVFIIGAVVQSIPGKFVIGVGQPDTRGRARARRAARQQAEYDVRELAGELTPAELAAEAREEAAAQERILAGLRDVHYADMREEKRRR